MTISEVEAHSRAVLSIQALLSKHPPGTSPYRIAERALDLAFNSQFDLRTSPAQEMLAEAEAVIERQVRAKLLRASPTCISPANLASEHGHARARHLVWHGALRPQASQRFAKAKLWLTIDGHCGDVHVHVR